MPFDIGPLVAVIALLIFGFVGLTILAPAAIAVRRRSKLAGVIAIAIAGFWAHVWLRPDMERTRRKGAVEQCETQLAALPGVFKGKSLLDESAGLSMRVIVQLLSERNLDFIELKPVVMKDGKPLWIQPRGAWSNGAWQLPELTSPYVRLRLSKKGDPACRPMVNGDLDPMPPFLPDTCLAIEEVSKPSAELALEHEAAGSGIGTSYGLRRLVKREPRQVLAQLTTSESAGMTSSLSQHRLSPSNADARDRDCRLPFYVLLDRVHAPERSSEALAEQVVHTRRVKAKRSLESVLASSSDWPRLVVAKETYADLTKEQEVATFVPEISMSAWAGAVEAARLQGGASVPFGPRLLDLKQRTLIELQDVWPYPWKTHALLDGFFVLKDHLGWDKSEGNLLVRFDRDGAFEWAVMVVPPKVQSENPMSWPQALYVVDKKLVLAGRGSRSTRWEVPLKQLPSMIDRSGAAGQSTLER